MKEMDEGCWRASLAVDTIKAGLSGLHKKPSNPSSTIGRMGALHQMTKVGLTFLPSTTRMLRTPWWRSLWFYLHTFQILWIDCDPRPQWQYRNWTPCPLARRAFHSLRKTLCDQRLKTVIRWQLYQCLFPMHHSVWLRNILTQGFPPRAVGIISQPLRSTHVRLEPLER